MGVDIRVSDEIDIIMAEKHLYSCLPMVFAGDNKSYNSRKYAFRELHNDENFRKVLKNGIQHLELPLKRRIAAELDAYWLWDLYYRLSSMGNTMGRG